MRESEVLRVFCVEFIQKLRCSHADNVCQQKKEQAL